MSEGIFSASKDIFGDSVMVSLPPGQHTNAQERTKESLPGSKAPPPVKRLIATKDDGGNTVVAWTENGNAMESFRAPTKEEMAFLNKNGRAMVPSRSLGAVSDQTVAQASAGGGFGTVSLVAVGVAGILLGVAGVYAYNKWDEYTSG
jgi:hypothetical protein